MNPSQQSGAFYAVLMEWVQLHGPRLAAAFLILIVGVVLSAAIRAMTTRLIRTLRFDALLERAGVSRALYAVGIRAGVDQVLGRLAGWGVLLLTLAATADVLGIPVVAQVSYLVIGVLPKLVVSVALMVGGLLLADLVKAAVARAGADNDDLARPDVTARAAWWTVVVVSATLALQQSGLDVAIVHDLILVVFAAGLLAFGLSLALGSQAFFSDFIAHQHARVEFPPGTRLRVGELEGVVLSYATRTLHLRSDNGDRVVIPCAQLFTSHVAVVPFHAPASSAEQPTQNR